MSPIGADVPQIDFSVQLKNYDHYFNVDNPKSAINFLETGQEMEIYYGYQLPETGEIEWVRGTGCCARSGNRTIIPLRFAVRIFSEIWILNTTRECTTVRG